jgi:hypothetical protein
MIFHTESSVTEKKGEIAFGCSSPQSVNSERRNAYCCSITTAGQDCLLHPFLFRKRSVCLERLPMEFPHGQKKEDQKQPARSPYLYGGASSSPGEQKAPTPVHSSPAPAAKKRPWRKPKDMPKRPLSAYNIFFADERKEILKTRGQESNDLPSVSQDIFAGGSSPSSAETQGKKLGFAGLARSVAAKWKTLDAETKSKCEKRANIEKARYKAQMKEYNEQRLRAQQQASLATSMEHSGSSSVWPAMPQTIASLGNIYDSTPEQSQQHPWMEMESFDGAAAMGASGSGSGLVMPKGSYFNMNQDIYSPAPAMGSNQPPADNLVFPTRLHQPEAKRIRRANSAGTGQATYASAMVHWNDDTALARRLSQPGDISILAAEMGQDQVDFFLRSLREDQEEEDDEEANHQR